MKAGARLGPYKIVERIGAGGIAQTGETKLRPQDKRPRGSLRSSSRAE